MIDTSQNNSDKYCLYNTCEPDAGMRSMDADGSKVGGLSKIWPQPNFLLYDEDAQSVFVGLRPNTFDPDAGMRSMDADGSKVGGHRPNTFEDVVQSPKIGGRTELALTHTQRILFGSNDNINVFGLRPPTLDPSASVRSTPASGSEWTLSQKNGVFKGLQKGSRSVNMREVCNNHEDDSNIYQTNSHRYISRKTKTEHVREYHRNDNICNNCGKSGHLFHQCKMPIISIGVIAFRKRPEQNIPKYEYLIIRRKETLGYIDFMRGKYSVQNNDYIMNMMKQMTNDEKEQLKTKDFDSLWKNIWGNNSNQYKSEEILSREKYNALKCGVYLYNDYYNMENLIEISKKYQNWEEPEWGFPKGRRNSQESDFECAIREFSEETGYSSDKLVYIQNVIPFEEIFTGSNYKSYKHKYFLMYMNYEDTLEMGKYQTSEVSKVEWKSFDECMKYFRPYNLEKMRILQNVETGLKNVSV